MLLFPPWNLTWHQTSPGKVIIESKTKFAGYHFFRYEPDLKVKMVAWDGVNSRGGKVNMKAHATVNYEYFLIQVVVFIFLWIGVGFSYKRIRARKA